MPVVSLTKGLERGSQLRMTEVLAELLPDNPAGVLTGPNLASEVATGSRPPRWWPWPTRGSPAGCRA